jgi:hypothetical protein
MSNFYTTYEIADAIPLNDYGYVITPDGKIHSLRYKFSHSYVICLLFKKYLPDFNLDINDLDFDSATYSNVVNKFVSYMPTIQISRIKSDFIYHYNFWFDMDVPEQVTALAGRVARDRIDGVRYNRLFIALYHEDNAPPESVIVEHDHFFKVYTEKDGRTRFGAVYAMGEKK